MTAPSLSFSSCLRSNCLHSLTHWPTCGRYDCEELVAHPHSRSPTHPLARSLLKLQSLWLAHLLRRCRWLRFHYRCCRCKLQPSSRCCCPRRLLTSICCCLRMWLLRICCCCCCGRGRRRSRQMWFPLWRVLFWIPASHESSLCWRGRSISAPTRWLCFAVPRSLWSLSPILALSRTRGSASGVPQTHVPALSPPLALPKLKLRSPLALVRFQLAVLHTFTYLPHVLLRTFTT